MLRRCSLLSLPCLVVACGGGGAAGTTPPTTLTARLAAAAVDLGPAVQSADIVVQLASSPAEGPSLLEVAIELPPALTLPASDRLQAATALATLDGDFVGNRFVVLCGDAQNPAASTLAVGPLFRLRITPSLPRQVGTFTVRLHNLRAATRTGQPVPVETSPTVVDVTVR